jgi:drug/metabolite transporter (DMT)-like permease
MPNTPPTSLSRPDIRMGYVFALLAIFIFSLQDGISKHLAENYPPVFVTMLRYWAFALFALGLGANARGGLRATAASKAPKLQIARSALLAVQIVVAITCFAIVGLIRTQAIFAATPLIATVMSVFILKERLSPLRWFAVVFGLAGVLVILRPHGDFFEPAVLLAVVCAFMFATYVVMTRMAGRLDPPMTSFFYTGVAGCAVISLAGPFYFTMMTPTDWAWMGTLCLTSVVSHYFLIKAYNILDASAVQPLSYLTVVNATVMGIFLFGESVPFTTYVGAAIVVAAGLLSVWSERSASTKDQV